MHIATNSEIIDISLEVKTAELAKNFSKILKKGDIVFFHGEIGVGKTTFIKYLVNHLQVNNHQNPTEVTSPTFNLVNEYDVGIFIIQHYDLYRLKSSDETKNIGLLENQKEILTLIEWPDKIDSKIDNKIELFFKYAEDMKKRFLSIKGLSKKILDEIN
ncbi:tRNA (adenosine(37)-N6)-threonylcarbamoyltransferase complex ATPase subunit type 1 TsaE [Candidatus Pelagibacter sp. Uisw_134_02]|jgi:tRNA threonylcarbamoyladenosine biosynthesis protein TsaE|uniref:tRNA (adenosine(37)-N6)-threonylcarbamoyltransferase complex ATPase subunit type 1 TsaE n=1 Tax=Candidatus Pelagibacter sp. Uisw_134_02 TaxID=3230990 RepID=UPI0039ED1D79